VGANKQATLSNYFDVSIGAGTYAPRPRQAYASKRLQKVVTDFRKEQKRLGDAGEDSEGEGSTSAPGEEEPAKKSGGKGKAKAKVAKASTKSTRSDSTYTRRGGKRKGQAKGTSSDKASTTKKQKVSRRTSSDDESAEVIVADVPAEMIEEQDAPPALRAKLRPRPKPRIRKQVIENGEQEESGDSADEFFTRRRG